MIELLQELLFRLRAGPRRALCWMFDRLTDHYHDGRFGIESADRRVGDLTSADFMPYQAVSYRDMQEVLDLLEIAPQDVFLDIGSGMGRALCIAALYPFQNVIGIEISTELCDRARQNLRRVETKLVCREIRVLAANAVEYAIPSEVSVAFFFNPLGGAALGAVLRNIANSVATFRRGMRILFLGTLSAERFRREAAKQEQFVLHSERVLSTGARLLIYNVQDRR